MFSVVFRFFFLFSTLSIVSFVSFAEGGGREVGKGLAVKGGWNFVLLIFFSFVLQIVPVTAGYCYHYYC